MNGDTFVFGEIAADPWWRRLLNKLLGLDFGAHEPLSHTRGTPCIIVTKGAVRWHQLEKTINEETTHHVIAELEGLQASSMLDNLPYSTR